MELLFLGTGTSDGIPVIGCDCISCSSKDVRDRRTRSSVYIRENNIEILIDASTDLRYQFLREGINNIDFILFTHHHADHIYGLDDIRPINQKWKKKICCYGNNKTCNDIRKKFPYFFSCDQLGGGVPQINLHEIEGPFTVEKENKKVSIIPIDVYHGKIRINGFRINNMAYITDASSIPESSYDLLKDLDVLVINALKYKSHNTHFSVEEALMQAERIAAKKTYLTHMCHSIKHRKLENSLKNRSIYPAYDGLNIIC
ncbi:MAG: MBL fold metallo-hydrolase [Candidatus Aureabacteria bacterium]|nr:MBL fold metallo-hydrolase [Candidatus Auribacterota bacterium]